MSTTQLNLSNALPDEAQLCNLFSFHAGDRTFAVFAEEVEGTADARHVAALPHSPPAIIGILCVRGRMLTALDPFALMTGERLNWPRELPCVVALRGDEQLALAAESFGTTITIAATDIGAPAEAESERVPIIGISRHGGEEINILSVPKLFTAAFQRKERRRRRF